MKKSRLLVAVCACICLLIVLYPFTTSASLLPAISQEIDLVQYTAPGTYGWSFTPTSDVLVTALGTLRYNGPSDVGLWGPDDNLLVFTLIPDAGMRISDYWYNDITPIRLTAGTEYTLGTYFTLGTQGNARTATYTNISLITVNASKFLYGTSLEKPINSLGGGVYGGPNMLVSAIPLPPALWLFGSGLLGLIGMAGKKAT